MTNLFRRCTLGIALMAALAAAPLAAQAQNATARNDAGGVRALVIPNGETVLASPVAGRITAMNVGLGRPFRQGAVLISLDCGEPEARLAMATADIASATEEYEAKLRMQGLEQASDVEVALAASAVAKAKAQVDLFKFQISQCSITAPWAGQTAKLHVRSHMTVTPGQPLLDLVRTGVLLLKLNVPSRWATALKSDLEFQVAVDETGKTYPARVQRINSRVDPVSQTIEIEATLLARHAELLPGMSGVATFSGMN